MTSSPSLLTLPAYLFSPTTCSNTVTYSVTYPTYPLTISDPTTVFTFDPISQLFTININDPNAAGIYSIDYKVENPHDPTNY